MHGFVRRSCRAADQTDRFVAGAASTTPDETCFSSEDRGGLPRKQNTSAEDVVDAHPATSNDPCTEEDAALIRQLISEDAGRRLRSRQCVPSGAGGADALAQNTSAEDEADGCITLSPTEDVDTPRFRGNRSQTADANIPPSAKRTFNGSNLRPTNSSKKSKVVDLGSPAAFINKMIIPSRIKVSIVSYSHGCGHPPFSGGASYCTQTKYPWDACTLCLISLPELHVPHADREPIRYAAH